VIISACRGWCLDGVGLQGIAGKRDACVRVCVGVCVCVYVRVCVCMCGSAADLTRLKAVNVHV